LCRLSSLRSVNIVKETPISYQFFAPDWWKCQPHHCGCVGIETDEDRLKTLISELEGKSTAEVWVLCNFKRKIVLTTARNNHGALISV
ncbi:hypothetical protein BDZ97DRAFT_1788637, partial [Flammula alnicola]